MRLRSQLILVVAGIAVALAALLGTASTLALRASLLGQVDDSLVSASDLGKNAPKSFDLPDGAAPDEGEGAAENGRSPSPMAPPSRSHPPTRTGPVRRGAGTRPA